MESETISKLLTIQVCRMINIHVQRIFFYFSVGVFVYRFENADITFHREANVENTPETHSDVEHTLTRDIIFPYIQCHV